MAMFGNVRNKQMEVAFTLSKERDALRFIIRFNARS
jgi:hypothetical protein